MAKKRHIGPYRAENADHIRQFLITLHALSLAVKNDDIEGYKAGGLDPEAPSFEELGLGRTGNYEGPGDGESDDEESDYDEVME